MNLEKLSSRVPRNSITDSNEESLKLPSVRGSKSQKNSEKISFGGTPHYSLK